MKKKLSILIAGAMVFTLSMGVFAAPSNDVDLPGQGYIASDEEGDGNGPGDMIDLTLPENGFFWYANGDTKNGNVFDIKSGTYTITNNSATINLAVKLKSYVPSNVNNALTEIETNSLNVDIKLVLTGGLAAPEATDLLNTAIPTDGISYSTLLAADGGELSYGFAGEYKKPTLPATSSTSDYVMVLEFEAVSSEGQ